MTNEQIIAEIAISIYGEDVVMDLIEHGKDIPLHTYQGWNQRSGGKLRVKKGEHGIECKLWKKKNRKDNKEESSDSEEDSSVPSDRDFYLCKAFLFRADQVERVE